MIDRVFQFHKGTIKTSSQKAKACRLLHFNSIKVRLKRIIARLNSLYDADFNSIKVRLKLEECDMFWSAPGISIP